MPSTVPGSSFAPTVAALRAGDFSSSAVLDVGGYYVVGDGGGGRFARNANACTDDGGSMLVDSTGACFYRISSNYGPREWGAHGDGKADDTEALQRWLDTRALPNDPAMPSQQPHIGAAGTYLVTNTLTVNDNVTISSASVQLVGVDNQYPVLPPFQITASSDSWKGPTGAPLVQLNNYAHVSGVAFVSFATLDTVLIHGYHVLIDGHAAIIGGHDNVTVSGPGMGAQQTGFQIKDCQVMGAANDNIVFGTANTRIIGNVIGGAGVANVYLDGGSDLTLANNMIEEAQGDGVVLDGAQFVKVIGNQINHNGKSATGGNGLRIRGGAQHIAVTGNVFNKNSYGLTPGTEGNAHVALQANNTPLTDISLSGNIYAPYPNKDQVNVPDYPYDLEGAATGFSNVHFYEHPSDQGKTGLVLPKQQATLDALGPNGPPGPLH